MVMGTFFKMLNKFVFEDGSEGHFELRFQPVPEGVLILSVDITDFKRIEKSLTQSQERYRMIFEGIKEGFILHEVIKDSKGRISDLRFVDLNPEAEKFFGSSKSELVGRLRSEMLGP